MRQPELHRTRARRDRALPQGRDGGDQARGQPAGTEGSKYRQLSDTPGTPRDLRSTHFLLHTDISDRSAKILLDKLEIMIALVSQYFGRNPVGTLECYVVRDMKQWAEGTFPAAAAAKIEAKSGSAVAGDATFSSSDGKVTMNVTVTGLTPGTHAIHLHEKGDCSDPEAKLAGPHWNPSNEAHGRWGEAACCRPSNGWSPTLWPRAS